MADVIIYSREGCPFCVKAKSFLAERDIPFEEINTQRGSDAWKEMKESAGSGSLPQVLIGDESIGGYSDLVNLEATGELSQRLGLAQQGPVSPLYDVIIIGGGPAGLSATIYTARKIMKTLGFQPGGHGRPYFEI
jgi:alkyl hydroperoxide reductase subunit F